MNIKEALEEYADILNWISDETGIMRIWLGPDPSPQAHDHGFELACKALRECDDKHLENVLKRAYLFALGDLTISSDEMANDLSDALCNLIGDDAFSEWVNQEES